MPLDRIKYDLLFYGLVYLMPVEDENFQERGGEKACLSWAPRSTLAKDNQGS